MDGRRDTGPFRLDITVSRALKQPIKGPIAALEMLNVACLERNRPCPQPAVWRFRLGKRGPSVAACQHTGQKYCSDRPTANR